MKKSTKNWASSTNRAVLPEAERSLGDLMHSFSDLLQAFENAASCGDAMAVARTRDVLMEGHADLLGQIFTDHRARQARAVARRAAGIGPDDPQPIGYICPHELERLADDDQALLEPPTCVAPKSIAVYAERPISAAGLAEGLRRIFSEHNIGIAIDFHAQARRVLAGESHQAST